ncbi:sigma-70 family RNA polymerase sigma factor [Candidatus Woesearchaeota archaeon]|nr:sigma-70 family RNA polymerase sigma factor [Candidatus Woesearchaeota archaeon]
MTIDPLQTYRTQINHYSLLKRKDEEELGEKILNVKYSLIEIITRPKYISILREYISSKIKDKKEHTSLEEFDKQEDEQENRNEQKIFSQFQKDLAFLIKEEEYTLVSSRTKKFFKELNKWEHLENIISSCKNTIDKQITFFSAKEKRREKAIYRKFTQLEKKWKEYINLFTQANLRLVISHARRYKNLPPGIELSDLIQEGNIGLMHAADKFNYELGNKFSTYASWQIHQSIQRYIKENTAPPFYLPPYFVEEMRRIDRVDNKLSALNGPEITREELAKKAELTPQRLEQKIQRFPRITSLHEPLNNDRPNSTLLRIIPNDKSPDPFEENSAQELKEKVSRALASLEDREKLIIDYRFGINMNRNYTLEEIGKKLGVTRERIRQIEAKTLRKLSRQNKFTRLNEH